MKKCHNKHHLLDFLFCKFCELISDLFSDDKECTCPIENQQAGELVVTGKDEITIALKCHPTHVKTKFSDECNIVPCDPDHEDHLEWEVTTSECGSQFSLHIEWDVSGVRTIAWTVCY